MSEMPFPDIRCTTEIYTGQETHRCILASGHEGDCIPADRAPSSLADAEIHRPKLSTVDDLLEDIFHEPV